MLEENFLHVYSFKMIQGVKEIVLKLSLPTYLDYFNG